MRRLTAVLILTVTLSAATACTPGQVTAFFAHRHQAIDQTDANFVAQALTVWDAQNRALLAYLAAVAASQRSCWGPPTCATLVRRAFTEAGIPHRAEEAVRVMMCESGGNPRATNGSHDGLFQQADAYWSGRSAQYGMAGRSAYDPWANAVVSAGMVRDTGGWSHWSCRP